MSTTNYQILIDMLKVRKTVKEQRASWKPIVNKLLGKLGQDLVDVDLKQEDAQVLCDTVAAMLAEDETLAPFFAEAHLMRAGIPHDNLLGEIVVGNELGTTYCVEVFAIPATDNEQRIHADVYPARTPAVWRQS